MPSSLAKTLAVLTRQPLPVLPPTLRSLSLSLAQRNAHYGARHFLKEELPRIAYANPKLDVRVTRKEHKKETPWKPEMVVELGESVQSAVFLLELSLNAPTTSFSGWEYQDRRYDQEALDCHIKGTVRYCCAGNLSRAVGFIGMLSRHASLLTLS